ncbi:hypothetical protein KVT40_003579 [Elsinoe batatas]|uniref:Uncharacterized protein n=1 Tax=Elsinoe batatas TaxID=2601811 RepID=A0A8K0PFC2_9PEZI|nr:hypothetical protein KVT40_003579 [Elsinoe batatas]
MRWLCVCLCCGCGLDRRELFLPQAQENQFDGNNNLEREGRQGGLALACAAGTETSFAASPQAAQIGLLHATAQGEVYAVLLRGKKDFPARLFRTGSDPLSMSGLVSYETHPSRINSADAATALLDDGPTSTLSNACKALSIPLIIDLGSSVRGAPRSRFWRLSKIPAVLRSPVIPIPRHPLALNRSMRDSLRPT